MAYINITDYNNIGREALDIVQQSDDQNRLLAEQYAIDYAAGYLRGRYDIAKTFSATGNSRNMALVGCITDIALYRMCLNLPARMGLDKRKEQFDKAIEWLADVQKAAIILDLPGIIAPDGSESTAEPIRTGSGIRNDYFW